MQMLHTSLGKSKKRKPNAKQRELQKSWEELLKKHTSSGLKQYGSKKPIAKTKDDGLSYSLGKPAGRETPKIPSLPFTGGVCAKAPDKVYTGNLIKGIATMHKSNAVPVFTDEQAVEISQMRRG
jgi:hypothetical protein